MKLHGQPDVEGLLEFKGLKWPKEFLTRDHGPVKWTGATRRLRREYYRKQRLMARVHSLLRKQEARRFNYLNRLQVKTLKAAKRTPHYRVRNRDTTEYMTNVLNPIAFYLNPDGSLKSESVWQTNSAESLGGPKWIYDFVPTLVLDPPRNPVQIGQVKRYSTSCSAIVPYVSASKPGIRMPKSKWPILGCRNSGQDPSASSPIGWVSSHAEAALTKALAKVYENDLNMNEYVVEWHQVLSLLRDPLRTMASWGKLLKKWFSKDSWMWVPSRSYRKLANGDVLVSQLPLGGVLMSMRTKRLLDPVKASKQVVDAACNRWLQYRYGIAPLALDITTVMDLWLNPQLPQEDFKRSARHWVSKTKTVSFSTLRWGPLMFYFKRTRQTGLYYSAVQHAKLVGPTPLAYQLGLDPSQWLRVIWNTIPYSFVADWLVDVDKWLTSRIDVPWITPLSNSVTAKRFDKVTSVCYKVAETSYGRLGKLSTQPVSVSLYEAINRHIDLPKPASPPISRKWSTLKNEATALALALNLFPQLKR